MRPWSNNNQLIQEVSRHFIARATATIILLCLITTSEADTFTNSEVITTPSPQAFSVCFAHGCRQVLPLFLDKPGWHKIQQIFQPTPTNASEERLRIAKAIAHLETLIGHMSKTSHDKGGTFSGIWSTTPQMDCIDESTNTMTYLTMLKQDGLLSWHEVVDRATRGYFVFGWPHTSAVILDIADGKKYAVDSWFYDNGIAPEIIDGRMAGIQTLPHPQHLG